MRKNLTLSEKILWNYLRGKQIKGQKFFRQYSVGSYILDFYCPKVRLAIELDGESHLSKYQRLYDFERTKYLKGNNIRVVRFWNDGVTGNIENVILKISDAI